MKVPSVTRAIVTSLVCHVGQKSSDHVARDASVQTDAVVVTETRFNGQILSANHAFEAFCTLEGDEL